MVQCISVRLAKVLPLAFLIPVLLLKVQANTSYNFLDQEQKQIKENNTSEFVEKNIDNLEVKASDATSESQEIEKTREIPVKVIIEQIGLNAPVIEEGKTSDGRMGVPSDNSTVGWWKFGTSPGELGSAVLAGHYKIEDGSPGVFYRLSDVKLGDEIKIVDSKGQIKIFEIVEREVYPEKDFPIQKVYSQKDVKRLNLITCTGNYIPELNDYSHRLVVYAVMKS